MPQSYQTGEFNSFVGGLVTEASPLTFPENASIDEANFVLEDDGSRRRRRGLDIEPNTGAIPTASASSVSSTNSTYTWENPGNISGKSLVCFQNNRTLTIVDRSNDYIDGWSTWVFTLPNPSPVIPEDLTASYASVDGRLVVAYDNSDIQVFEYDGSSVSQSSVRIKIRDLFGVAAAVDGIETWNSEGVSYRPDESTSTGDLDEHIYNLRNQGWLQPRTRWFEGDGASWPVPGATHDASETMGDPIRDFMKPRSSVSSTRNLPSNADSAVNFLYPRTNVAAAEFKEVERFDCVSARNSRAGNFSVAKGGLVIDLLNRGSSRSTSLAEAFDNLRYVYGRNNPSVSFYDESLSLPTDRTNGGVKHVAEYAGRVWYGGIDGSTAGGDDLSPSLTSYVFYSQLVKDFSNINRCYQAGDPTSKDAPDRLDTDGGFIRLSGCSNIKGMVNVGASLLVFAETGVWQISGSDSGEFNANNQSVTKVSEKGTFSPKSIVLVEGTVLYWSDDGIYQAGFDEVGNIRVSKVSVNIDSFYQRLSFETRQGSFGIYDSYDNKVRWIYNNNLVTGAFSELVFDIRLGAFYPNTIGALQAANSPVVLGPVEIPPYNVQDSVSNVVTNNGDDNVIIDDGAATNVTTSSLTRSFGSREVAYITWNSGTNTYSFSTYNNENFRDWESLDGTGIDAEAYLVTGYIGTGDSTKKKVVPYVYFHFYKTEDGFTDTGTDLVPTGQSSCLVQAQWDWANSATSGKWGREFQAYRHKRPYMPTSAVDTYDNGEATVVSKNKLRGHGRVLSLYIKSEPDKDLQLLGWGMSIGTVNRLQT